MALRIILSLLASFLNLDIAQLVLVHETFDEVLLRSNSAPQDLRSKPEGRKLTWVCAQGLIDDVNLWFKKGSSHRTADCYRSSVVKEGQCAKAGDLDRIVTLGLGVGGTVIMTSVTFSPAAGSASSLT